MAGAGKSPSELVSTATGSAGRCNGRVKAASFSGAVGCPEVRVKPAAGAQTWTKPNRTSDRYMGRSPHVSSADPTSMGDAAVRLTRSASPDIGQTVRIRREPAKQQGIYARLSSPHEIPTRG